MTSIYNGDSLIISIATFILSLSSKLSVLLRIFSSLIFARNATIIVCSSSSSSSVLKKNEGNASPLSTHSPSFQILLHPQLQKSATIVLVLPTPVAADRK